MKSTRTGYFVAAVMALAIASCQETPISPMATDMEPSFSFNNGPAEPGNGRSAVVRGQFATDFLTWEETGTDDLAAYHIQANDIFFCGGAGELPVFEFQNVNTPSGNARGVMKLDDAGIAIYRPADLFAAFGSGDFVEICRFLAEDWLYVGTHTMTFHGQLGVGPTFGWSGHGDVTDPSGASFRYSERAQYVASDVGFDEKVFDINVRRRGGS
jgi:hypothetical protein